MKIICETNVVARRPGCDLKGRFQKSTLAIGKKYEKSKLCIILITANNKTGTKYDLTSNISNIFRKFITDGKCTISFKLPEIDLQIKTDPVQLKAFLNVMKSELCPQQEPLNKQVLKSDNKLIRAFGSSSKTMEVVTKLTIKERSALPTKGFPRTLRDLTVTNIGCSRMPIGIINLTNLVSLDLSKNQIIKLPKALGNLKLTKLILSENKLGEAVQQMDWDWLNGENIRKSLAILNVSRNSLKFLPSNIFKCLGVGSLDASFNEIVKIPFAIKMMGQLRSLNISNNQLTSLPYTLVKMRFDMIDLSSNKLSTEMTRDLILSNHSLTFHHHFRAPSLLELSARAVIKHKIPFMTHNIPLITKDILFHSPLCVNPKCEALCFDSTIFENVTSIGLNSKQKITSDNRGYFNADGPFCSRFCSIEILKKLSK